MMVHFFYKKQKQGVLIPSKNATKLNKHLIFMVICLNVIAFIDVCADGQPWRDAPFVNVSVPK